MDKDIKKLVEEFKRISNKRNETIRDKKLAFNAFFFTFIVIFIIS